MKNVPLIPFQRPEPQVFAKQAEDRRKELQKAAEAEEYKLPAVPKKKGKAMSAKKKNKTKAIPFTYENNENMDDKSEIVQFGWQMLSAMDPDGELFVNDKALVIHQGEYPEEKKAAKKGKGMDPDSRRPEALGLDDEQIAVVKKFAIPDAREENEDGSIAEASVVGVLFTPYQLIEAIADMAYQHGRRDEQGKVTSVLTSAAIDDDEDDDYEEEEEEEAMDVIDEEEYDDDD